MSCLSQRVIEWMSTFVVCDTIESDVIFAHKKAALKAASIYASLLTPAQAEHSE